TNATAGASDSATFCRRVTTLLSETFNALSVSLWVVDPQSDRLALAASTQKMAENPDSGNESGLTLKNFRTLTRPFDLDSEQSGVAAELRAVSAGQFQHGGHRIAVPLRAADHWLGIAILADRVHAVPYTVEEYDLLECIGDQVGASLLNLQMASAMIATKEFEALQTVSSFFAHDLKNAASTLSLMLTNLPVHFDDPAFRADALRAIGNTVERINQLISRAAKLQAGLSLNRTETDLNGLLKEAIQQFSRNNGIRWVERFERLPKVPADREQLQSVVLNLLLNAQEAVGDTGTVTVETSASEDWAEFRVSDTGCGMTPEFLRSSLFRPLQTSKKKGLGIGLFQSRMIVDAHRGKISAVSEAGAGTTFRVQLPLQ
nr:GAF domain-containing protein [Chthoniobacterales bacterium]